MPRSTTRPHLLPAVSALVLSSLASASGQTPVLRMNCGGGPVTGVVGGFDSDQPYIAGLQPGFEGGELVALPDTGFIGGLWNGNAEVAHTGRSGFSAYRADLPDGDYLVRFHMAEMDTNVQGPQLRVFDLSIEGVPVLDDVDIAGELGLRYATEAVFATTVSDGTLDVEAGGDDPALLCAIEVYTTPASPPPPPAVTGLTAKRGYGRTILAWDPPVGAPGVTGFRVFRAAAPQGPYALIATTRATPPRLLDDGATPGVPSYYRVAAVDWRGQQGAGGGGPVQATPLSRDDSDLRVYEITLDEATLLELNQLVLTDPKEEVPGEFTYQGETWDAEVRYRGNSSLLAPKKSWTVKFAPNTFEGRRELNLKATFIDATLSREPLGTELFPAVGHAASVHRPVHLIVNGEYVGVYNDIEEVDDKYLAARNRSPGSLYKCEAGFRVLATPEQYEIDYDKKTNVASGYGDFISLVEMVNGLLGKPGPDTLRELVDVFHVDDYLDALAVTLWIGNVDSVEHNYFVLHDLDLERWEYVTWDNDYAFWPTMTTLLPPGFGTLEIDSPFETQINMLKTLVLEQPELRWRYVEKVRALMAGPASAAAMDARITERLALVAQDASADHLKLGWESDVLIPTQFATLSAWAGVRSPWLDAALAGFGPATPPTDVWINELVPDNDNVVADEANEFEDYVELHNPGGQSVDVGGMYLTDDMSEPTKWQIPPGTQIPGGRHLLVWCDDDEEDGPLHATFKLGASGEEVGLFDVDGTTLLDFVHYGPIQRDVAWGRTSDAGPFFASLPTPTPEASNTTAGNLPPFISWVETFPAQPNSFDDVAVTCQVVDADGITSVSLGWSVDGGPITTVAMDAIGADRYGAAIPVQPAGALVDYSVQAFDGLGLAYSAPADAPEDTFSYVVLDPQPNGVTVNELMADNDGVLADEAGEFDDWFELYNDLDADVDLSGMYLTDDLSNPVKWPIPDGTTIFAGETLLFWADEDLAQGPLHAAFKLSSGGEELALFDTDDNGNALVDAVVFGQQTTDVATGRLPDGQPLLVTLLDSSPGAANVPPPLGVTRYDAADPTTTTLDLAVSTPAQLGGAAVFDVSGTPPDAPCAMFIGLVPIDADLTPLGFPGSLLVLPVLGLTSFFAADGAGEASVAFPLPGSPSLIGLTIHGQALTDDGVTRALSNGAALTIGS